MSQIVDKLKQYLDAKNIKVSAAEVSIGVSNGALAKAFNNRKEIKTNTLEKFLKYYSKINPEWVLGKDDTMERSSYPDEISTAYDILKEPDSEYSLKNDKKIHRQSIPLYDIDASAGLVELLNGTKEITPLDTLHIPNISKADGAIYITGDGMYPLLKSGDIIIFKQITDVQNDIFWGHMYLVSIKTEDDGYLAVKYVHKSEKGAAFIRLVSENKHHDDKHVLLSKINALALIKASLRYHTMN